MKAKLFRCKSLAALPLLISLTGCEARLDLEGVEKTLAEAVRRTDQWQAIAANDQTLVVVGQAGILLTAERSTNPQWRRQQLPTAAPLVDVVSCGDGWLAILAADRTVWLSRDNGAEWQPHGVDTQESLLTITCAPDNSLWLGGSFSTLLNSTDGGQQWQQNAIGEDAQITAIQFLDSDIAYAVGEFGLVARSDDGGSNWRVVNYMPDEFYPQSLWFRTPDQGWVTGLTGTVLRTDDGGQSWVTEETPTSMPLYQVGGISTASTNDRYVLGDNSTLLLGRGQQDSGWRFSMVSPSPMFLADAIQIDNTLLVVGGGGAIYDLDLNTQAAASQVTNVVADVVAEGGL
ncbi:WD40/YVTN/BNR-like repeat-containing protein [Oceanobacter mangrovi]|uniref:WD40/YVTN/BNR-like repeat-containing protein n=1 Tax=Oceanobacter mangrovi TaxID=2862510 RepID=UPI001C8E1815|nr:YCF48-related protein [Oceanobacter mangrovi]